MYPKPRLPHYGCHLGQFRTLQDGVGLLPQLGSRTRLAWLAACDWEPFKDTDLSEDERPRRLVPSSLALQYPILHISRCYNSLQGLYDHFRIVSIESRFALELTHGWMPCPLLCSSINPASIPFFFLDFHFILRVPPALPRQYTSGSVAGLGMPIGQVATLHGENWPIHRIYTPGSFTLGSPVLHVNFWIAPLVFVANAGRDPCWPRSLLNLLIS